MFHVTPSRRPKCEPPPLTEFKNTAMHFVPLRPCARQHALGQCGQHSAIHLLGAQADHADAGLIEFMDAALTDLDGWTA